MTTSATTTTTLETTSGTKVLSKTIKRVAFFYLSVFIYIILIIVSFVFLVMVFSMEGVRVYFDLFGW